MRSALNLSRRKPTRLEAVASCPRDTSLGAGAEQIIDEQVCAYKNQPIKIGRRPLRDYAAVAFDRIGSYPSTVVPRSRRGVDPETELRLAVAKLNTIEESLRRQAKGHKR
jgi:hypothetical protein